MKRTNSTGATPSGASFPNGSSSIGTNRISGLTFTANDIKPGYFVTVDKGFPSTDLRYEVTATNPSSGWIDIEVNSTSSETGITVETQSNMYTDGNGGAYARTVLNASDRNQLQEEIANVILDNGGSLDSSNRRQLSSAVIKSAVNQTMNGNLTIAASKILKVDSVQETTPSNGITFANLIRSFVGLAANKIQALTGSVTNIENQLGHIISTSLQGSGFAFGYKNKIQVKISASGPWSTQQEYTLINGIPNFNDAINFFGLNFGSYMKDSGPVNYYAHGIDPAIPRPTIDATHCGLIGENNAGDLYKTKEINAPTWVGNGDVGIGVKRIAANDYDLVFYPNQPMTTPITITQFLITLEF